MTRTLPARSWARTWTLIWPLYFHAGTENRWMRPAYRWVIQRG